jgi:hypothetical protein
MSSNTSDRTKRHTAGALDIRNIIGGLLGAYGVILLVVGLVADAKAGTSETSNVWSGIVLIVVGAIFLTWARIKPVVVPEHLTDDTEGMDRPPQ